VTQPPQPQPQPQGQQPRPAPPNGSSVVPGPSTVVSTALTVPPKPAPTQPLPSTAPANGQAAAQVAQVTAQGAQVAQQQQAPQPPAFKIVKPARAVRWFKGLFYGVYGAGKTTLAATADDVEPMRDVIMADVESGDLSVIDRDFDVVPIGEYKQIARLYEYLRAHCRERDSTTEASVVQLRKWEAFFKDMNVPKVGAALPAYHTAETPQAPAVVTEQYVQKWLAEQIPTPKRYRTLLIDSLSELDKYLMYQLLGIKVGVQRLDTETQNPEWAEWGRNAEMLRLLIRSMRDLPMNVIFVCSANQQEDERKRQIFRPNLPGKLGGEVQGFMDCVGYLIAYPGEQGLIQRRLYITPGQTYDAKNRFVGFKDTYLQDPTMNVIWDLVMRYYKPPTPTLNAPAGQTSMTAAAAEPQAAAPANSGQ
jgi:AAA domain